jgi:hypothetical protein
MREKNCDRPTRADRYESAGQVVQDRQLWWKLSSFGRGLNEAQGSSQQTLLLNQIGVEKKLNRL